MEKLIILRIFFCFPLIGFILPDLGSLLSTKSVGIPMIHLLMEAVLIVIVAICTWFINAPKRKDNTPAGGQPAV
ncbi:hypothetical protein KXD93_24465 [Mucilaginibacter sp. BJC16-A38]|uniref:hypothetical protein n=1 Tax=Mucilaginibacter phenanthrenivorans TaxID=1234842 RepID=UPI0021589F17|nr:hypothetical protein [Mucilaginibacter phenanthrenivorans]MCR8560834.1 hypothetical protein [Mucilaginibacter phenanthrenivorans]MDP9077005.1 hypothetical protein [Bacteroidota bacterium]